MPARSSGLRCTTIASRTAGGRSIRDMDSSRGAVKGGGAGAPEDCADHRKPCCTAIAPVESMPATRKGSGPLEEGHPEGGRPMIAAMLPAPEPIRVLTVDDHPLMREGIAAVLGEQADMAPVGEAADGWQGLQAFERLRPDVTLMDIQMPGMDGLEALSRLRTLSPGARVIVLTTFKADAQAWQALKLGASGYLLKTQLRTELLDAIRAVHRGHRWIPNEVAQEIAAHAGQ